MFRFPTGLWRKLSAVPNAEEHRVLRRQIIAIFAVISVLNLLGFVQRYLLKLEEQNNVQRVIHSWDGWIWYVWLLAAPATLLLIRRCPWERGQWRRSLAGTAVGSVGVYLVITNLRYLLRILPNVWLPDSLDLPISWANYVHTETVLLPGDFVTYCGFYAASFAYDQYVNSRHRREEVLRLELARAQLESDLTRAQWSALTHQIQPHFLFNAFNGVSSLVRQRKNEAAVQMIAELGELFRLTMEAGERPQVALHEDLVFAQHYLNVERARFGDKLRVEVAAADDALDGLVPNLLLQPLVENAVKHGISARLTPGCIRLAASREGDRLRVSVSDDGPGFSSNGATAEGIGLANTRNRLRTLYGADFALEIESPSGGGTTVTIDLPWREAGAPAEPGEPMATA